MISLLSKRVDATKALEENITLYIEAFVRYYGEEERETITNKFNNMLVIGYQEPKSLSLLLSEIYREKSFELIDGIMSKSSVEEEKKDRLKKALFDNTSFIYINLQPIYAYINYINGNKVSLWDKEKVVKLLINFYPDVTVENLDEKIQTHEFKIIDELLPCYEEARIEFQKFQAGFKDYDDYVLSCDELLRKLENKHMILFAQKMVQEFPNFGFEKILDFLSINSFSLYSNPMAQNYFGNCVVDTPLIDAFSSQNDQILLNGNEWRQSSIKNDRVKFYKNLGLDLGDDYSLYEEDERAIKLTPSKEMVDKILELKAQAYTLKMNEYYYSLPEYEENRRRIMDCGIVNANEICNPNDYENRKTYVGTCFNNVDGNYNLFPVLCFYVGNSDGMLDHAITHELNHIYELNLKEIRNGRYECICGWDILNGKIKTEYSQDVVSLEEDNEKRQYELFNEIINELIAQEISQIMIDMNAYVFTNAETKKFKGMTSYEHTMFLVRDFYSKYKPEIIQSRKNGDMSILFDLVGKENFDALNSLFHEFYESFSGFSVYNLYSDLKAGVVSENTSKYASLTQRRDVILQNMDEVSKNKQNNK